MVRNLMFLIAMSLGIAGAFQGPAFFVAGAVVALTTFAMRFQDNRPVLPPKPVIPTDPVDVLSDELIRLNDQMDTICIEDLDDKDSGSVITLLKITESRDKISQALVELAKERRK